MQSSAAVTAASANNRADPANGMAQPEESVESLKERLETARSALEKEQQKCESLIVDIRDLNEKLKTSEQRDISLTLKLSAIEKQLAESNMNAAPITRQDDLESLKEQVAGKTAELDALRAKIELSDSESRSLRDRIASLEAELCALQKQVSTQDENKASGHIESPNAETLDIEVLTARHVAEVQSLKASIKSLESQVAEQLRDIQQYRSTSAQVSESHQAENHSDHATELALIKEQHEKAIKTIIEQHDAKLASMQQVFDSEQSALKQAIRNLETQIASNHADGKQASTDETLAIKEAFEKKIASLEASIANHMHEIKTLTELKSKRESEFSEIQKRLEQEVDKAKSSIAQIEAKHQASLKETRASFEKSLADSNVQIAALQKQSTARINELEAEIAKRKEDVAAIQKTADTAKKDLETAQKQISKNKEVNDMLVKSLQEQLSQISTDKSSSEKRMRAELEDKARKDRVDLETKYMKEKIDLEEKFKKEKVKMTADLEKARKDMDTYKLDSAKRFEKELAAKSDELAKTTQRIKSLEQDLQTLKADGAKATDALNAKIAELNKQLASKGADAEKLIGAETSLREQLESAADQLSTIQSKYDILTQELEVAHASNERSSKLLLELEDSNKKLKSRNDELLHAETGLKRSIAKLEREREDTLLQMSEIKAKMQDADNTLRSHMSELQTARNASGSKISEFEARIQQLTQDNETLSKKLIDTENEMRILERKSTQLVKDLQKQLIRERKQKDDDMSDAGSTIAPSQSVVTKTSTTALNIDPNQANPKIERLTGDLHNLAQENEVLNRRVRHAEDELKSASDRLNYLTNELEHKTKIVQQYILQDHSAKLQPDVKARAGSAQPFSMNILSSTTAMQKLDPAILSSINMKMQKLLEELTSRMLKMEDQLKQLGVKPVD
eukprot:jgi/Hompol1/5911/HPOL_002688-RA